MNIWRKPIKAKPLKPSKFQIGDKVEILIDKEPYYSDYAGNPKVVIPKGSVGTIGAVNVPSVCREGVTFNCVDFVLEGVFSGNPIHKNNTWRCAVFTKDLKKV